MTGTPSVTDDDLHAAADGRLPPERQTEIEAAIAADTAAAAQIAFYRRVNAGLHAAYDVVLSEPVPDRLRMPPRRRHWRAAVGAAAAVALLAAGTAGGWLAHEWSEDYERPALALADLAAEAHAVYAAQVRHPVEVPAAEKDHLQRWLSKSLDRPVQVPDLSAVAYEFIGGRLLPADRGVAGQLMYQNTAGSRVTLYFRPASDPRGTAFRFVPIEGISVFYWHDEKLAYALAAELPREQLRAICNEVYARLNPGGGPMDW
jgi:anti-sigma factor RsiW